MADIGEQPEILLGLFHETPVIGVVRTLSDHLDFKYFDPATFHVEWEVTLPKSADVPSLYGQSDNALIYLDQAAATIDKMTPQGATIMHRVSADEASHGVRILSIDSR